MRIKKLILSNFGKFHGYEIDFAEDINVVYGMNEAGKSTIERFIYGMLFGFFKPYSKKRIYSSDYDKYLPWRGNEYNGVLIYEHEGKEYRVERNFLKKRDCVDIFDNITGDNLNSDFNYNSNLKLYEPIVKDLAINQITYSNTLCIPQLKNEIDDLLGKELNDLLLSVNSDDKLDISIHNIIDKLDKEKKGIGSISKKSSPYGKVLTELKTLAQEKEQYIENDKVTRILQVESKEIEENIGQLEAQKKQIEKEIELYNISKSIKKEEEIDQLYQEIEQLKKEADKVNNTIDEDVLEDAISNYYLLERLNQEKIEAEKTIASAVEYDKTEVKVCKDEFEKVGLLNTKISSIINKQSTNKEYEDIKVKKKENDAVIKRMKIILSLTTILFLLSIVACSVINITYGVITALIFVINIVLVLKCLNIKKDNIILIERINAYMKEEYDDGIYIEKYESELSNIFELHGCRNYEELEKKYYKTIHFNDSNKVILQQKIGNILEKIDDIRDEVIDLCSKCSMEELKQFRTDKMTYNYLMSDIQSKQQLVQRLLDEKENDSSNLIKQNMDISISNLDSEFDEALSRKKIKEIDIDIRAQYKKLNKNEEKIASKLTRIRNINEITQDIRIRERLKNKYNHDVQVIDLITEVLGGLTNTIHNNSSGDLNLNISKTIQQITNSKYDNVKVTEDMNIIVEEKETKKYVDINCLSNGTKDQLYLSLRMAILNFIDSTNMLPVIIDECFVQYDDYRLANILRYFAEHLGSKQLIIFTSHKRECEILRENGISYNSIKIN